MPSLPQPAHHLRNCPLLFSNCGAGPESSKGTEERSFWNNTPRLWFADGANNSYDNRMSDNVFDIATHRPLDALIKELGGLDECRRLGFVFEDENKIMSLSTAGMGYLCFVKAAGMTSVAEAFAAGYQCRAEE
jgi:hypothetical protein